MRDVPALQNAIFGQIAAQRLLALGYRQEQVFAETGCSPALLEQAEPSASFADIAGLFGRGAELSGDPLFGFRLGCETDFRQSGLFGYILRASPTIGEALNNAARYAGVMGRSWRLDASRLAGGGELSWMCQMAAPQGADHYSEFLTAALLSALREAAGNRFELQKISFLHSRRSGMDPLEAFFGCPIEFEAGLSRAFFSKQDLQRPLLSADHVLLRLLCKYGDLILQQTLARGGGLAEQVEQAVLARLSGGSATLANVAADLGMSPRTLSRKLSQAGSSYFFIIEGIRKKLAVRYLRDSDQPLSEVAFLLGYSGLSSFSEAFRRWTGESPGQFRNR